MHPNFPDGEKFVYTHQRTRKISSSESLLDENSYDISAPPAVKVAIPILMPAPTHLIGIDCGTSVVKAALYDRDGRELGVATATFESFNPAPDRFEYDPQTLWETACLALRQLVDHHPELTADNTAIGVTGAGNGLTLVDGDGRAVRPGILAVDGRAANQPVPNSEFAARAREIHGQSIWPGQTIELLRWIKANEPDSLEKTKRIFALKDFVKWKLTGVHQGDVSEVGKTGLLDLEVPQTTSRLLAHYGLDSISGKLPPVADSTSVIGRVTKAAADASNLPEGTAVVNGLADIDASSIGAGAVRAGQLSIVAGTWSINQLFTDRPTNRDSIFGTSRHAVNGVWEELEASASSTANLTWYVREFCGDLEANARAAGRSVYDRVNELVATVEPATTPVFFHPYLYGSNTKANARAGFNGLAGWQTRNHQLSALFEGVVYGHAVHVQKLLAGGSVADEVRLSGGASRSDLWSQMFADVLNLPVAVPAASEVGALGAAICAAAGTSVYPDIPQATAAMSAITRRHDPDPARTGRYADRFATFQRITDLMVPVWDELERNFSKL